MFSLWIIALDRKEFLLNQGEEVLEKDEARLLSSVLDLVLRLGLGEIGDSPILHSIKNLLLAVYPDSILSVYTVWSLVSRILYDIVLELDYSCD